MENLIKRLAQIECALYRDESYESQDKQAELLLILSYKFDQRK